MHASSILVQSLDLQPPQITGASSLLFVNAQRPAGPLFLRVSVGRFVMLPYLQQTICLWFSDHLSSLLLSELPCSLLFLRFLHSSIYPIKSWEESIASENSVARETAASK